MNNQKLKDKILNTKNTKGITLIALIITIIVLLILAVVAINAIQDGGTINYAKNARDEYEKAQVEESKTLKDYLDKIDTELKVVPTNLKKYILGSNENGRDLLEIYNGVSFIDDETTPENESETTKVLQILERGTKRIYLYKV